MRNINKDMRDTRGSILIVAVIFATIAALTIGSYIRLAGTEMRLANTQFYSNASLNLAEAGVEEVLYALNQGSWSDKNWGQSDNANTRTNRFEGIPLGSAANGEIRVRVEEARSDNPTVFAHGEVTAGGSNSTAKQIEVKLRRRSLYANGITTRNMVIFSGGNAYVASYRSSDPTGSILDGGSVASISVEEDAVDVGNAEIFGTVATGGEYPVIRNGKVWGFDTPAGVTVDPDRISTDFSSSFPPVEAPDDASILYEWTEEIPILVGSDDPENPLIYRTSEIDLAGSQELRIEGHAVLIVDGDVSVTGNAGIVVGQDASVSMYVEQDFHIRGNGVINESGIPADLRVYGTNTEGQDFSIGGNAVWYGAVYAPNSSISLNGGGGNSGQFRGAVVADRFHMNGNTHFYYDEDLRFLLEEGHFGAVSWRELYGVDRHSL